MNRSSTTTYPENFQRYINQVKEDDLKTALKNQVPAAEVFLQSISEEFSNRRYAPGKWTIKEVLQHVIDAERVFAYRALCIARKDEQTLPSFDENEYAANAHGAERSWHQLIEEFVSVRKSTEYLYDSFAPDALDSIGNVSDYTISVSEIGFVLVGHVNHHLRIIQERYIGM